MYGVRTAVLKRQVRRSIDRFPNDFMFKMTMDEFDNLRCIFGTSNRGGTRYLPMAFSSRIPRSHARIDFR